jgi:hypothetical protein
MLQDSTSDKEASTSVKKILGKSKVKFITLIYQLIVCEDTYYSNN